MRDFYRTLRNKKLIMITNEKQYKAILERIEELLLDSESIKIKIQKIILS